jgi:hypothetical protein
MHGSEYSEQYTILKFEFLADFSFFTEAKIQRVLTLSFAHL